MRYGSLCSGIGGLDVAVERVTGATPAWFCEMDHHAAATLARWWPNVPVFEDVKTTKWEEFVVPALRKDDLADEMYAAYANGASIEEVADMFGRTRQSVWMMFKRRDLPLRQRPDPKPTVTFAGERYAIGVQGYYRCTRGDRSLLHRDIWRYYRGDIPDNYDVHHIDHDKTNNTLENLTLLTKADHTRLHAADEGVMPPNSLAVDIVSAGYPLDRVSRSPTRDDDKAPTTRATSGPTSSEPFAFYDPGSSCWRTSQGTLDLGSMSCSVILPKRGSMRSGRLFERPTREPATSGHDCSLLPTPVANDSGNTPENHLRKKPGCSKVTSLTVMARGGLLPTPTARDWKDGRPCSNVEINGLLGRTVWLLPTPTAWLGRRPCHSEGDPERWTNPERSNELSNFIAWIGATTDPRSNDGSTSSDGTLPFPPMSGDDSL